MTAANPTPPAAPLPLTVEELESVYVDACNAHVASHECFDCRNEHTAGLLAVAARGQAHLLARLAAVPIERLAAQVHLEVPVPASFVIYKCKIRKGMVIDIPLPPEFTTADVKRLTAFLETQVDDPAPEKTTKVAEEQS